MEALRQVSDVLVEMGHHIEIASTDATSAPWLAELPFTVHALGPGRTGYLYAPRLVPWLRENAGRFDAVIVNGLWQYHELRRFGGRCDGTETPTSSTRTGCSTRGSSGRTRSST